MRKRLVNGIFWALVTRSAGIFLTLFLSVLLSRNLSPDEMGAYFVALSLVNFVGLLGVFGLPQVIVKIIAESNSVGRPGRAREVILKAFSFMFFLSSILALSFYFFSGGLISKYLNVKNLVPLLSAISLLIILSSFQTILAEVFRGFHDIKFASLVGGFFSQTFLVILLLLWYFSGSFLNLSITLYLTNLSYFIAIVIAMKFLCQKLIISKGDGSISMTEILSNAWPLCFMQLVVFVATQADLWMVSSFTSAQTVAVYGAAQKLAMMVTLTHGLIISVMQSSVAELNATNKLLKLEELVRGMSFVAIIPAFIILLIFIFFGDIILSIVYGEFYKKGYAVLLIIGTTNFISMLLGPAGMVLIMTNQQKEVVLIILVNTLITIILAYFMLKIYGYEGVACSWGIGAITYGLFTWCLVKKRLNIRTDIKASLFFLRKEF